MDSRELEENRISVQETKWVHASGGNNNIQCKWYSFNFSIYIEIDLLDSLGLELGDVLPHELVSLNLLDERFLDGSSFVARDLLA